jgi:ElaB/YqjD/DUF883 family membrane-anchored ribosome-binding protein
MMEEEISMAEPARNQDPLSSTQWPEAPSNPGVSPGVPARPALPETATGRPLGEWPYTEMTEAAVGGPGQERKLHGAGETVGNVLGTVVHEARELPGRMRDLKRRFQVISGRKTAELKQRASELGDEAESKVAESKREAHRELLQWRLLARRYARREPFRFVAGAAMAGFAIGFLLGLWREE